MGVKINDRDAQLLYGKGLLLASENVTKGDIVKLLFYSTINNGKLTPAELFYSNIMISYERFIEFEPYRNSISKSAIITVDDFARIPLPTTITSNPQNLVNTNGTDGVYAIYINTYLLDENIPLVENNTDVTKDIFIESTIDFTADTYNNVFNKRQEKTFGISKEGRLIFYPGPTIANNNINFAEWIKTNPTYVCYKTGSHEEYQENSIISHIFKTGEIIKFNSQNTISYDYTPTIKDKTLVCFGDSITGMCFYNSNYPDLIDASSNIRAFNVGFSGCRWTDHASSNYIPYSMNRLVDSIIANDFSSQLEKVSASATYADRVNTLVSINFAEVDWITIFYGTNDFASNALLTSEEDINTENKQRTNMEDCISYCIEKIYEINPAIKILLITPYFNTISNEPNSKGYYQKQYADKIEEIGKRYNIPCLNIYNNCGVNSFNQAYYEKDDAHPTEMFKWIIANKIIDFINKN